MLKPEFMRKVEINELLTVEIFRIAEQKDCLVIKLQGHLTTENYLAFIKLTTELLLQSKYIIIDCALLAYISSAGIGSFIPLFRTAGDKDGKLVFIRLTEKIMQILNLMGFTQLFEVKQDLEEALRCLELHNTGAGENFPLILSCPDCGEEFQIAAFAWIRCPQCKALHYITSEGKLKDQF